MNSWRIGFATVLVIASAFGIASSRSGSFMNPVTGAPGEGDCTDCHSGTVNSGSGSVDITVPAVYAPGDTINVSVSLADAGLVRWGFEITALDTLDQPIGTMVISDAVNTQINTVGGTGRQYVFHTSAGTFDGTADASPGWTFKWAAPSAGSGPVTFWLAGLAANSSGTNGDFTYTTARQVTEGLPTGIGDDDVRPDVFTLHANYPNPFNPTTRIDFTMEQAEHVRLDVFDMLGRHRATLVNGVRQAGAHSVDWYAGAEGSGVYFYRIQSGSQSATRRMMLLK